MKKILVFLIASLFISSTFAERDRSEDSYFIRNINSGDTNQGECSIIFRVTTTTNALVDVREIDFHAVLKDGQGKVVDWLMVTVPESEIYDMVQPYFDVSLDSKKVCKAIGHSVVFNKVEVKYKNSLQSIDIVQSKQLKLSNFRPVKIIIGSQ
ncbi:hypothetical protein ACK1JC_14855 [Acinetobacter sp. TY2]|uniref:hypothetical protein n=1 Tax=Acinetobacter sp. TY2 TaxID=3387403 RepID=UPI003917B36D